MAGLVPAIHVFAQGKSWMPGTRPDMTNALPHQLPCYRLRHLPSGSEDRAERGEVWVLAAPKLLGVNAGGHEQAIDPEVVGAFEIRAHRISDREHALERGATGEAARGARMLGLGECEIIERPVRLCPVLRPPPPSPPGPPWRRPANT